MADWRIPLQQRVTHPSINDQTMISNPYTSSVSGNPEGHNGSRHRIGGVDFQASVTPGENNFISQVPFHSESPQTRFSVPASSYVPSPYGVHPPHLMTSGNQSQTPYEEQYMNSSHEFHMPSQYSETPVSNHCRTDYRSNPNRQHRPVEQKQDYYPPHYSSRDNSREASKYNSYDSHSSSSREGRHRHHSPPHGSRSSLHNRSSKYDDRRPSRTRSPHRSRHFSEERYESRSHSRRRTRSPSKNRSSSVLSSHSSQKYDNVSTEPVKSAIDTKHERTPTGTRGFSRERHESLSRSHRGTRSPGRSSSISSAHSSQKRDNVSTKSVKSVLDHKHQEAATRTRRDGEYRSRNRSSPIDDSQYYRQKNKDYSWDQDRNRHSKSVSNYPSKGSSPSSPKHLDQPYPLEKGEYISEEIAESKVDISLIIKEYEEFEKEQKEMEEAENSLWIRCSPAEQYYQRSKENPAVVISQPKLIALHEKFCKELLNRSVLAEAAKEPFEMPPRKIRLKKLKSPGKCDSSSGSSSSESESSSSDSEEEDTALEELERKKKHPYRLHQELWYNDPGEMNDGPLCRCSAKSQRSGIRHGIYPGEEHLKPCDLNSNNAHRLHHYRITMSPHTNFLTKVPTIIEHDNHEFIFEGFSMFSHASLTNLPACKVIRFNIEYTVLYFEEGFPENFTVESLNLFSDFLFHDLLELVDLNWRAHNDSQGCQRFHFMPRFARNIEDGGKELLSMNVVLQYLLSSSKPLIPDSYLDPLTQMSQSQWQDWADKVKGMIVTIPGMKPCSLRVDQLDREQCSPGKRIYPEIVHFGIRPPQLSYAGNPSYQKAWRSYVKFRHLLANKPKVEYADRHKLLQKEMKLTEMRMKSNLKRDVTVVVSSKNLFRTGIMCDIVQHALLLPVLVCHLRLHQSLDILEQSIEHKFMDRWLLQLALTHPSYRENFGTNPDHARNSLTNCGIRQPEYGDRRIHYMNTRKRGINTLINIMSRFGKREETLSHINHNERLEFLGDAVVEFLSSIHLFYMFPDLEEGGLATYRAAIVQNQHLAVLAKKLQLEKYMLYAHGSDLCHDLELRHAMANCFEALMGALFLDGGIKVADKVFSQTLFSEPQLLCVWYNYPPHPLQEQEPHGDRQWIESVPLLKELHKFEQATGIEFTHIRLLARAFTHRSVGFNNLTLGSNQRLEFLGDTVLQLVASEYLYKFFPEHHEGHLSLLRSSLVNNRTQSVVCDDLGMAEYAIYPHPKGELKTKDKADLLEAFLGALYVDKDLEYCKAFCEVCFFPRLQPFIMNQDWNDPKSKLQQCCLTLRSMDGGEPDIPLYKVIECKGPTNTRVYTVAVYFRGERLATGSGHSIQHAEMAAASNALDSSKHLFPQLNHQRRVIERSVKQQVPMKSSRAKRKSRRKKK